MIDSLLGILLDLDEDYAVLDVRGVRFRLDIPASSARQLPAPGAEATLYTRLSFNPNDGAFLLFGFATTVERDCFDILTSLPGIGPRKSLMILSQVEIASFASAIVKGDTRVLSKIKGVGQKTAERLVVELREKMAPYVGAARQADAPPAVATAIEALIALGCKPLVAESAVRKAAEALGADAPVEALVREGLKRR